MRQNDQSLRSRPSGLSRLDNPAVLVCAALVLAMLALTARIVALW